MLLEVLVVEDDVRDLMRESEATAATTGNGQMF